MGLVEVPMGTDLRTIIFEIGGGIRGNAHFKAVQLARPLGGCRLTSSISTCSRPSTPSRPRGP
ncbi:MAG: hypothetical protein IPI61_15160 [Syntrophaceae bacterium]|nr:hypothetical protein [Syntrophaceae bacterium]